MRNVAQITAALKKAADRVARARPILKRFPPEKLKQKGPVPPQPPTKTAPPTPQKGISVRQLFRAAPRRVIEKANEGNVRIIRSVKKKTAKGPGLWTMTATDENGMTRTHIQLIKSKDGLPLAKSKGCLFTCDCGFFKFYCDWALWKKGASELKESIDEPPDMTNPRYLAIPCKHLYVVCSEVIDGSVG